MTTLFDGEPLLNLLVMVKGFIIWGVPVIVAAGNDYIDACDISPASAELAITVGGNILLKEFWGNLLSVWDLFSCV